MSLWPQGIPFKLFLNNYLLNLRVQKLFHGQRKTIISGERKALPVVVCGFSATLLVLSTIFDPSY